MIFRIHFLSGLLALTLVSCGGGSSTTHDQTSPDILEIYNPPEAVLKPGQKTILVQDTGFDLGNSSFKDKIAGAFQVVCDGIESRPTGNTPEEIIQSSIEVYKNRDTSCRLVSGIKLMKSSDFDSILSQRESWNEKLRNKNLDVNFPNFEKIHATLSGRGLKSYNYHGTFVASEIVYKNPEASIVFIQRPLASSGELARAHTCTSAETVKLLVSIKTDSRYIKAFAERPVSTEEADLQAIRKRLNVVVENWSFASLDRVAKEGIARSKGCPFVDLKEIYRADSALEDAREAHLLKSGFYNGATTLILQAAGNSGNVIESGADSVECSANRPNRLLIGAYNSTPTGPKLGEYNHGACVDAYGLGENVIGSAPDDFLMTSSGTSMSAPLAVRYAFTLANDNPTLETLKSALLSKRDKQKFLPYDEAVKELAYVDRGFPIIAALKGIVNEYVFGLRPLPQAPQEMLYDIQRTKRSEFHLTFAP